MHNFMMKKSVRKFNIYLLTKGQSSGASSENHLYFTIIIFRTNLLTIALLGLRVLFTSTENMGCFKDLLIIILWPILRNI